MIAISMANEKRLMKKLSGYIEVIANWDIQRIASLQVKKGNI